jgi:hypothetical protein
LVPDVYSASDRSKYGAHDSLVVKALCCKPEGRRFETRWGEWIFFNLANPPGRTRPYGLFSLWQKWLPEAEKYIYGE